MDCVMCCSTHEEVVWQDEKLRIILVDNKDYPGYLQVIWNEHCKEMSDLSAADQQYLMKVVFLAEGIIRRLYHPDKVNLASLGNVIPHAHWHVIPRWEDDPHYPNPIWGERLRLVASSKAQPNKKNQLMMIFAEHLVGERH